MKKLTANAVVAAIGLVWGTTALAGSISAPAASTKYAVESMTAATAITLPNVVYTMGVTRPTSTNFTIILTPSSPSTVEFNGTCPVMTTSAATATTSIKRQSGGANSECAYDIAVNGTAVAIGDTFTIPGVVLSKHGLNAAGTTVNVNVNLWDQGESARIDNSAALTKAVAASGNALTMVAAADTGTVANVNDTAGPLFGFSVANDDTATVAKASFTVRNNNDGVSTWLLPDALTPWDFVLHGTAINVSVAGNFAQLATNGFLAASAVGPAIVATATAAGATGTFALVPTNLNGTGLNTAVTVSFTTARTASMGTARTFGVSAVGDVVTGADVALAGSSAWWTWSANASQLMTPYFTTNSLFLSRFFLLNSSSSAVSYSADCYSETGNVVTYGAGRTGTLSANGLTAVAAGDICTFSGATRGAIIFTINAPINTVKANYQAVDPATLNNNVVPLTRPYNQANTTE